MSRKQIIFFFVIVPDIILLYASLYLAVFLRYGQLLDAATMRAHLQFFSGLFIFWMVVFFIHGLFEVAVFRRYTTLLFNLLSAMIVNFLVAVIYFYFQPTLNITPRRFLLLEMGITFLLLLSWHLIVKYIIKKTLTQGVYVFSLNGELKELETEIDHHSYLGYRLLGGLNEQSLVTASFNKSDGIILPDNLHTNPDILKKIYTLRTSGVGFYNYREFYENLLRRVYLSTLNEIWFLENINYQEKRFYNIAKRAVDLLFGAVGFLIFLISFPFCAIAIKLSDKGPVLFIQNRAGKDGKTFQVYKYRTMKADGANNTWTAKDDPRITRVGKFLRKSRLDELPQFINLLLGNMSLVGPRPEQPNIVEDLRKQIPFYDERHLVKPGLTGWAQLHVYAASVDETKLKLQYDLYYIKNRSLLFDLEIILKTLYYIFTWQGK